MGASVRPDQDLSAVIAARRQALAAAPAVPTAAPAPAAGGQDLDAVIAARRAALTAPSSGNVDLRVPAAPAPRSRFQSMPTAAESTSSRLGSRPSTGSSGAVSSALAGAAQGSTLGFADEALGAVEGANRFLHGGSFTQGYQEGRDKVRAQLSDARSNYPYTTGLSELGGMIATGRALPALGSGAGLARVMAEGAGIGGIAGAGNADGDLADRARGAAWGAGTGAVTGGALYGVGKFAQKPISGLASVLRLRAPSADASDAPIMGQIGQRVLGVSDVNSLANDRIANAVTRGGKNFSDIRTAAETASPDKPIILADLAGEGAQGLAAGARGTAGSGARTTIPATLKGRLGSQAARVGADMTDASGIAPINPYELADQLRTQKLEEANQLYPIGHAHGPIDDPKVLELLKRPYVQDAWKEAQRNAGAEGKTMPTLTRSVEHPIIFDGTPLTFPDGSPRTYTAEEQVKLPTSEMLHNVKRVLDDRVNSAFNRGGKGSAEAHSAGVARDELKSALYKAVPAYKTADEAFATASRLENALQAGRSAANADPRAVDLEMKQLQSPEELRLYRAGLQDAQLTTMASTNKASSILPRDEYDIERPKKLGQAASSPDAARELAKRSLEERRMIDTKQAILGGSNTAEKLGAQGEIGSAPPGVARALTSAAMGHLDAVLRFGLKSQIGDVARVATAENADALARKLMAGARSREELLQTIDELNAHAARASSTPKRAVLRRLAESLSGTAAGEVTSTRH